MHNNKDLKSCCLLLFMSSILLSCTADSNHASMQDEYPIPLEISLIFKPTDTTEYFVKSGDVYAIDYTNFKTEFAFAPVNDDVKAIAYRGSDLFYATNSGVFQVNTKMRMVESKLIARLSLSSYEEDVTGLSLRKLGGCYVLTDYRLLEVTENSSKSIINGYQIWAWWAGIIEESPGVLLLLGKDGEIRRLPVSDSTSSGVKVKAHLYGGYGDFDGITKSQTSHSYRAISGYGTVFQFLPDSENVEQIGKITTSF